MKWSKEKNYCDDPVDGFFEWTQNTKGYYDYPADDFSERKNKDRKRLRSGHEV